MISEGSCDTEDWSNDAENSTLPCIKIENSYFKLYYIISQYYFLYYISQINAALMSIKDSKT